MRKIMKADAVIALFVAQSQAEAATPTRNLYFRNNVLFSYGSHYVIAVITGNVALVNSTDSSVTTNKHRHAALLALAERYVVIEVANPTGDTQTDFNDNMDVLRAELTEVESKLSRARSESMKDWYHRRAARLNRYLRDYYDYSVGDEVQAA